LLLRFSLGVTLIGLGTMGVFDNNPHALVAIAGAAFLLAGLWTPLVSVFLSLNEIWIVVSPDSVQSESLWLHIFLALLAASLAMLGPGAWSVDARIFGRRRIDIPRSPGSNK
jgi:putative oxidoreductase